jgi:murein DD-endopeptidase MepM/ murein hydrolase activator NlpD
VQSSQARSSRPGRVVRLRLPRISVSHILAFLVISLVTLVAFNLFGSEADMEKAGQSELALTVQENLRLIALLDANQRDIHAILRDEHESVFYDYLDSIPRDRPTARSVLRSNADYAGIYSGFFQELPHRWPLRLERLRLNSSFGWRGAVFGVFGQKEFHPGLDFNAAQGTPVLAAAAGTVKQAVHADYGYGNHVILLHPSGYETLYAHLRSVSVKKGQEVKIGSVIGMSGSTGASSGPHLHYEVRLNGKPVDPADFVVF